MFLSWVCLTSVGHLSLKTLVCFAIRLHPSCMCIPWVFVSFSPTSSEMKVLLATNRTCYETNVRHYSAVSDVCSASCLTERRGVQSAVYFTFPLCSIHTVPARTLINEERLGSSGLPNVTLQPPHNLTFLCLWKFMKSEEKKKRLSRSGVWWRDMVKGQGGDSMVRWNNSVIRKQVGALNDEWGLSQNPC